MQTDCDLEVYDVLFINQTRIVFNALCLYAAQFNIAWEDKENLTLQDVKALAPLLFVQDNDLLSLEKVKILTEAAGTEWNDSLTTVFENNKTSTSISAGEGEEAATADVIEFSVWKLLVPVIFESQAERETRLAAEWQLTLAKKSEGNVIINYQMYNEEFPISKNSLTAARIDEDYGLTDVMPGCRIRLSSLNPTQRTLYENEPGRGTGLMYITLYI